MPVTVSRVEIENQQDIGRLLFEAITPSMTAAMNQLADKALDDIRGLIDTPVEIDPVTGMVIRSLPGEPPRTETGELLNNLGHDIIADASAKTFTLVLMSRRPSTPSVPNTLEHGGTSNWGYIEPRPYMAPAMMEISGYWLDIIGSVLDGSMKP